MASFVEEVRVTRTFSLSNPIGHEPWNLPVLLRRVAQTIEREEISSDAIVEIVVSQTIIAEGPWWTASVYWIEGES